MFLQSGTRSPEGPALPEGGNVAQGLADLESGFLMPRGSAVGHPALAQPRPDSQDLFLSTTCSENKGAL